MTLVDKEGLYKYEMCVSSQSVRIWEWGQTGQGSGVDLSSVGQGGKLLLWLGWVTGLGTGLWGKDRGLRLCTMI